MGKKTKKNRFNQVLDIEFNYSHVSVADDAAAPLNLNLSKEKVSELQKIKAQLPSAPQAVRLEEEIARIPENGPFRLVLVNVDFNATKTDIEEFFLPLHPTNIRLIEEDGRFRGFCFVDFETRADLSAALNRNNSMLLHRRVTMRIADQHNDGGNKRGFATRDGFNSRRPEFRRGFDGNGSASGSGANGVADSVGWTRRPARPQTFQNPPSAQHTFGESLSRPVPSELSGAAPERPIIRLAPRTKTSDGDSEAARASARHAAIFGAAKPVDIAPRERPVEQKTNSLNDQPQSSASSSAPSIPQQQLGASKPSHNAWTKPLLTSKEQGAGTGTTSHT